MPPGREEMERPLEEEEREVDLRGDAGRRAGELGATPPTGPAADFVPGADQPPERRRPPVHPDPRGVRDDDVESAFDRVREVDAEAEERDRAVLFQVLA